MLDLSPFPAGAPARPLPSSGNPKPQDDLKSPLHSSEQEPEWCRPSRHHLKAPADFLSSTAAAAAAWLPSKELGRRNLSPPVCEIAYVSQGWGNSTQRFHGARSKTIRGLSPSLPLFRYNSGGCSPARLASLGAGDVTSAATPATPKC